MATPINRLIEINSNEGGNQKVLPYHRFKELLDKINETKLASLCNSLQQSLREQWPDDIPELEEILQFSNFQNDPKGWLSQVCDISHFSKAKWGALKISTQLISKE